jgi:hypothetical protein
VALREDASALAIRGIAMAQLGDLVRARDLLRTAAKLFGPAEPLARVRCLVAEMEIALASRDLSRALNGLPEASLLLEEYGDQVNAAHARLLEARRLLLIGRLYEASGILDTLRLEFLPAALKAGRDLAAAGVAMRRLQGKQARKMLGKAELAARQSGIPGLLAEVEGAQLVLDTPVAYLRDHGEERPVGLEQIEERLADGVLIVDGCTRSLRNVDTVISLAAKPVLFALAQTLGEAWPEGASREGLIKSAFELDLEDELDRQRLRVEIGRLRAAVQSMADVVATKQGFALVPKEECAVVGLSPLAEEKHASVLALLADGEAWSSSAVALALGQGQRTVQRALEELAAEGKVQPIGQGRKRKWITPLKVGFATALLLPGPWPSDLE